jgi:hypothetical protein
VVENLCLFLRRPLLAWLGEGEPGDSWEWIGDRICCIVTLSR